MVIPSSFIVHAQRRVSVCREYTAPWDESASSKVGDWVGVAALGAVWASRVEYYAGIAVQGDRTAAPVAAQVAALQDTLLVIVAMILLALMLSAWGLMRERHGRDMAVLPANPSEGS